MSIKPNDMHDALVATESIYKEMTFGSLVRSLRLSDEISQVELAKRLGVSKSFLSDVEHNRKNIGIAFAKKVADALEYSVEPLIEILLRDELAKNGLNFEVTLKDVG
jgi:transcriptional regulator with XRE-family HTH domain